MKDNSTKKMKTKSKVALGITSLLMIAVIGVGVYWFSMPVEARNMISLMMLGGESYDEYIDYQVVDYSDNIVMPLAFEPEIAEVSEGDENVNIATATEMVLNENSGMLKKGNVRTVGPDDYNGWSVIADEGASNDGLPYGPSPLSYYTAGVAANLHTQITKAAEVKGVELDYVSVEVHNTFHWDEMLTAEGKGYLDVTTTDIIIESDESEEVIEEIKAMALSAWTVGEALANETSVVPELVVNGDVWSEFRAEPGIANSVDSFVGDYQTSLITDEIILPTYTELIPQEDQAMGIDLEESITNLSFEIYAITESANDSERPYLKNVIISAPTFETWQVLSDEFMGEGDQPVAPTSLEYFTLGTSLCLTSQTTITSATMKLDYTDYRVEHQFMYRNEDVGTSDMAGYMDTIDTYIIVESDESMERLETFYWKSLALCFAGEGLTQETEMVTSFYLNGTLIN